MPQGWRWFAEDGVWFVSPYGQRSRRDPRHSRGEYEEEVAAALGREDGGAGGQQQQQPLLHVRAPVAAAVAHGPEVVLPRL